MAGIETIDLIALGWFIACAIGYQMIISLPKLRAHSITGAVQRQRVQWVRGMATRMNHAGDAILHGTLSSGNAFFASTTALAIGGLASIVGQGERADAFLNRLPFVTHSSALLWEVKVLLLMGIFLFAFFKFAWAFRLTHYTSIMIGAIPNPGEGTPADVERLVAATATISGLAAEHSNAGLRSYYFAAAAMAWFFSPWTFMLATAWVVIVLIRRDFFSRARNAIMSAMVEP